jgi:hypothetical protein
LLIISILTFRSEHGHAARVEVVVPLDVHGLKVALVNRRV